MKTKLFITGVLLSGALGGFIMAQNLSTGNAEYAKAISADEAKTIALKTFNGDITEFEYDNDGLNPHYDFEIVKNNEKVDIEIDAKTGEAFIKEREKFTQKNTTVAKSPTSNANPTNNQAPTAKLISQDKAASIAVNKVGGGKVVGFDLDKENGIYIYEVEVLKGNVEYDVDIDATTGEAIIVKEERKAVSQQKTVQNPTTSNKVQNNIKQNNASVNSPTQNQTKKSENKVTTNGATKNNTTSNQVKTSNIISQDKAISIALAKSGGGNVTEVELDNEYGTKVYEIEILKGNVEYDFDIDAVTGKIIKMYKEIEDWD